MNVHMQNLALAYFAGISGGQRGAGGGSEISKHLNTTLEFFLKYE